MHLTGGLWNIPQFSGSEPSQQFRTKRHRPLWPFSEPITFLERGFGSVCRALCAFEFHCCSKGSFNLTYQNGAGLVVSSNYMSSNGFPLPTIHYNGSQSRSSIVKPASLQSSNENPASTHSFAEKSASLHSSAEKPASLQSMAEKPASLQLSAEKPAFLQSRAEKPAILHSSAEKVACFALLG